MNGTQAENKQNKNNRDTVNDIVRIIAMFLVIGVHWFGSMLDYWPKDGTAADALTFIGKVTRLGVPLFFSLSGYYILGKEITDIRKFYYKRFVRIVVPYLLYAVFYVFYFTVFEDHQPALIVKNYIVNVLTGNVHGTHWFVYSILGLYFATPFLSRMFRALSDREVMLLYVTVLSFGLLNCIFGLFGYTFGINSYVFDGYLLVFMSGYCTQRCFNVLNAEKWKYLGICRLLAIAAMFALFCITEWGELLCMIAGLAVAGNSREVADGSKVRMISTISKYSYSVYLAHAAVISAVLRVYTNWGSGHLGLKAFAGYIAVFAASFIFVIVFDNLCTNRVTGVLSRQKRDK